MFLPFISGKIWVDVVNGIVFFCGFRDTPLEKHLYAISLDEPGKVRRLTALGYSHSVFVLVPCYPSPSTSCTSPPVISAPVVVDVFSNTSTPPQCQVRVFDFVNVWSLG